MTEHLIPFCWLCFSLPPPPTRFRLHPPTHPFKHQTSCEVMPPLIILSTAKMEAPLSRGDGSLMPNMTASSVGGHSQKGQRTVSVITVIHLNSGRKPSVLYLCSLLYYFAAAHITMYRDVCLGKVLFQPPKRLPSPITVAGLLKKQSSSTFIAKHYTSQPLFQHINLRKA